MVPEKRVSSFPIQLLAIHSAPLLTQTVPPWEYLRRNQVIFPFCQLHFQADQFPDCKAAQPDLC